MAVIRLPTRTDVAFYDFEIDLEQRTFRFEFHWNERDGAWYFAIFDAVGEPLLSGRKVVLGIPLIARFRDPRLPAGDICAIDTSGQDKEASLADLGDRVRLLYTESTDIPDELKR